MLTETLLPPPIQPSPPIKLPKETPKEFEWPKNYPPKGFDWLVTLQELVNGRPITEEQHDILRYRAGMWPTCACGQLCRSLPRVEPDGRPVDRMLFVYGRSFYEAVKVMNWNEALVLFKWIETRTDYLLNEQRMLSGGL